MMLFARIFSLLFLATTLLAQDAPEKAPELEKAEPAVEQVESAPEAPPADPDVPKAPEAPKPDQPAEPAEPDWDPTKEDPAGTTTAPEKPRRQKNWNRAQPGRHVFGQDIVIGPNETVHELVLLGGSVDIQGEVERDVVAIGGSIKVSGTVGGDVVVVGGKGTFSGHVDGDTVIVAGQGEFSDTAHLNGDAVFLGGPFNISPNATIDGHREIIPFGDVLPHIEWLKKYLVSGPLLGRWLTFDLGWPWVIAGTFAAIYFGLLLVFPAAARAVYTALEERPVTSIFSGLLSLILFAPLTFLLIISIVGIIVIPFLKISLLLALLFGKVGVICLIGRGFARTSGASKLHVPFLAFLVGAAILTLSYAIPFFGIFAWAMATVFGLGGAIVALANTFKREEAKVQPVPVTVSTIRPTPKNFSTGTVPGASEPLPGATFGSGGAATLAATAVAPDISSLNPNDTLLLPRAGFWKRFLAALLDHLLLMGVVIALPLIGAALYLPIMVAYFVGMWTWKGTTVGSLLLGLKLIRTDGSPVTFSVAFVRSLLSFFSFAVGCLGFLWAAWDTEKQTWHDKIAGTVVVKMPRELALV